MDSAIAAKLNKVAPCLFADNDGEAENAFRSLRAIARPQIERGAIHITELTFGLSASLPNVKQENIADLLERNIKPLKNEIASLKRQLAQKASELQAFVLAETGVDVAVYIQKIDRLEKEITALRNKLGEYATNAMVEKAAKATEGREPHFGFRPEKVTLHDMAAAGAAHRKTRVVNGDVTPSTAFYEPILALLNRNGGKMAATELKKKIPTVLAEFGVTLTKGDLVIGYYPTRPTEERWKNTIQVTRNAMKKNGTLKKDSKDGLWELA